MKAEDLKALRWSVAQSQKPVDAFYDYALYEQGGEIVGEFFGRVGEAETRPSEAYAALAASSPELAIACLAALDHLEGGEEISRLGLHDLLTKALLAAGVEISE